MVYNNNMIKSFKHKGLKKFYESGSIRGIQPIHANRLSLLLASLDAISQVDDLKSPSFRLHKLNDDKKDLWSITVQANWPIVFEFESGNVYVVDYLDYH